MRLRRLRHSCGRSDGSPHSAFRYIVIFGAAFGILVASGPLSQSIKVLKSVPAAFKSSGIDRVTYYQLMGLLLTIFTVIRKEGVLGTS